MAHPHILWLFKNWFSFIFIEKSPLDVFKLKKKVDFRVKPTITVKRREKLEGGREVSHWALNILFVLRRKKYG